MRQCVPWTPAGKDPVSSDRGRATRRRRLPSGGTRRASAPIGRRGGSPARCSEPQLQPSEGASQTADSMPRMHQDVPALRVPFSSTNHSFAHFCSWSKAPTAPPRAVGRRRSPSPRPPGRSASVCRRPTNHRRRSTRAVVEVHRSGPTKRRQYRDPLEQRPRPLRRGFGVGRKERHCHTTRARSDEVQAVRHPASTSSSTSRAQRTVVP